MIFEKLEEMAAIENEAAQQHKHTVKVCLAAGCLSTQSDVVKESIDEAVKSKGLEGHCKVKGVGCLGLCSQGPLIAVETRDNKDTSKVTETMYQTVTPDDAAELVDSLDKKPVKRLVCPTDVPFFARQTRAVGLDSVARS